MINGKASVFSHYVKRGWSQLYFFIADIHFDSPKCNRKLLSRLLKQAKKENAFIMVFGDLFDCMGGKYDPRTHKGDILEKYKGKNYFDLIINAAVEFFQPYKDNILFIAPGNHEFTVTKKHEFSMIDRFIKELNPNIIKGEYAGFIRFKFEASAGGRRSSKVMYYTHGSGGNAPVTKGVIKISRRMNIIDADIYVSAHIHQPWNVPTTRIKLSQSNKIIKYEQEHIQLPSFKEVGDWETRGEMGSAPSGGYWVNFLMRYIGDQGFIDQDVMRGK